MYMQWTDLYWQVGAHDINASFPNGYIDEVLYLNVIGMVISKFTSKLVMDC